MVSVAATSFVASSLDPRGPAAAEIAGLWWLMLALGTLAFLVFAVFLIVGLFRKRAQSAHDFPEPEEAPVGRAWLLGGGVVMPTLLIGVVFVVSVAAMGDLYEAPADALRIEITASQWWWEATYPDQGFTTANEIHIPVGRQIELSVVSTDVIHSFWVPSLGGKIDALPERSNTLVFQADDPDVYFGSCAEFCGLSHAKMNLLVVAESPEDFDSWVDLQQAEAAAPENADAIRGMEIFLASECVRCHTIRGTPANGEVGPDLTHVASRRTIGAVTVTNTREHLLEWVADAREFKPGIEMPPTEIPEEDLRALITYLESLR